MKGKILILIDWYLPGRNAGGPVKSIESLVWAMGNQFEFYILTTNRDLGEKIPYNTVQCNQWIKASDHSVIKYLDAENLSREVILKAIHSVKYDFLYLNSFFSKYFSIIPLRLYQKGLIKGKVVLAPRGMLSSGALKLKSQKKKIFIKYAKLVGLHKNILWHATYEEEVREIKRTFGSSITILVAPNFSKPINGETIEVYKNKGILKLFYLSRIARVKNLHVALNALRQISIDSKITYDIYGNIEDEIYFDECQEIISKLPENIQVSYKGKIENNEVAKTISPYHFLFLPTSNENFGHSIFESMQAGCPVIISNKTPWRNLEAMNCGWDVEPLAENFKGILEKCINMDHADFIKMRLSVISEAQKIINDDSLKASIIEIFTLNSALKV